MAECRNSHKPGREMGKHPKGDTREGSALPPVPLTPSFLLTTFSSTRKSDLSCFYTSARDHDLEIKAASHMHLSALSQRLGWGLDALTQQSVQAQRFPANVLPCCSVRRHTSINSNKTTYLTNKTGIGALTSRHQS